MFFRFKNKDKSHIFHEKATFTLCSAAPCLFCFEAICDRYFFKLNCFKLIGWFKLIITMFFHQSNQFVTDFCTVITENYTVITKKWHCDYRKLHCDYRKFDCCVGLTILETYQSSSWFKSINSLKPCLAETCLGLHMTWGLTRLARCQLSYIIL
jgi:hypothetical protein